MSVLLKRHAKLESVTWQASITVFGSGNARAFASPGTVLQAYVERVRDLIRKADGSTMAYDAAAWFDLSTSSALIAVDHRLVFSDFNGIVVMVDKPKNLQTGVIDHVEVFVRRQ